MSNLPLFLARHIYDEKGDRKKVSRPAIRIATIGVAIGLAVMIVTVSVVMGFKHTIRDKVAGFGSHIQIQNIFAYTQAGNFPICLGDSLTNALGQVSEVRHIQRYTHTQGILKTDDDFMGVMLKGLGSEYDTQFLKACMIEGELPIFCDSTSKYPLVISKTMADKLHLNVGDRLFAYFINNDDIKTRRFTIKGIYQTNMKRFDDLFCLTDIYATNKLNGWRMDQCSGAELLVNDFTQLENTFPQIAEIANQTHDKDEQTLAAQTIMQAYPQVFSWLGLLDINVWIILALMIAVAGFTMISGLLIIILERTQMIGILKALGARNSTIRHTFLWFAAFIIGRGLLWGNIIGLGIVVLQIETGFVSLDPQTYYVNEAPMEINIPIIIALNIATLIISVLVLIAPSYLVSRIHPARSMRYE
ncbi:ABC transporter permease [Prevotella sp. E13-17]|uniref:ABC transporter permease n=1 Tax=Prevotella sp. E13-17 TaxID=2913616 RepID=UPI001EDBE043|nr:FtsX-like permease family protein [Prevotella sp. E13-17]UKK51945.1 ABC transporter permease [Prevotella sp. E13-17]